MTPAEAHHFFLLGHLSDDTSSAYASTILKQTLGREPSKSLVFRLARELENGVYRCLSSELGLTDKPYSLHAAVDDVLSHWRVDTWLTYVASSSAHTHLMLATQEGLSGVDILIEGVSPLAEHIEYQLLAVSSYYGLLLNFPLSAIKANVDLAKQEGLLMDIPRGEATY